jgi:hypothetical protein
VLEGHFSQFDCHAFGRCWQCVQTAIVEGSIVEDGNAFEITKELEVLDTRDLARPAGHCWLVLQCRRTKAAAWQQD